MNFGGIQRFSLCDYPGKTAAVLFCQGCNFRCPFCHNGNLLTVENRAETVEQSEITTFLKKRRGLLDAVVITGGEPTLQADLLDFCRRIQRLGFAVKLDSNGSRPAVLEKLLKHNCIDFIAMDIKATPDNYHHLTGVPVDLEAISRSIKIIEKAAIPALFRTTWVPSLHHKEEHQLIPAMLPSRIRHIYQTYKPDNALEPVICQ